MFRFYYYFLNTIISIYVLVIGCTRFTLFVPYLICVCIFYVIWQLNALNGYRNICFSAIKKKFLKGNKLLVNFKRHVLFSLVYLRLLFKNKK